MNRSKFGGLIKKAAAVILSMVMAFGAVSVLPNSFVKDNAIVANAEKDLSMYQSVAANDCIFYYSIKDNSGDKYAVIEHCTILNDDGVAEIPATITSHNVTYPVTALGYNFLFEDKTIKNLIMPNSITSMSSNILWCSTIEKLTISDNIENIGYGFCNGCPGLKRENVKYNGSKIKEVSNVAFGGCPDMADENGAICLKNWLIRYNPNDGADPTNAPASIRIADLSNDGVTIDSLANNSIVAPNLVSADLQGIKRIGVQAFKNRNNLTNISNTEDVMQLGAEAFDGTKWLENSKDNGLAKINSFLLYYRTDGDTIDLTSGDLKGTLTVAKGAFADCENADTLVVNSDTILDYDCFYEAYKQPNDDTKNPDKLPLISTHKIKDIYLDGEKLEYTDDNTKMPLWVKRSYMALIGSEWVRINVEAKTKDLCEQLDIPYYGLNNDKIGTHTPEEEFYIMLKVHEYLSMYDYDHNFEFRGGIGSFLLGGYIDCQGYADLAHYLFECAGVESKSIYCLSCGYHVWNSVRIGDEWFESDNGWDAQNNEHKYEWFGLSSDNVVAINRSKHTYEYACDSWHISLIDGYEFVGASERVDGLRTIGDVNGDGTRNEKDVYKLWEYLQGSVSIKDTKAADINFDGVVDITDGVLLQNFVKGTALDVNNVPDDRLAAGYRAIFANSRVPTEIDTASFVRVTTDRYRYIELPEVMYNAPKGKKFAGWDYGQEGKPAKAGEKVQISNPYTVITPVWKNENDPDDDDSNTDTDGKWLLGDVDGSGTIDISDVSKLINHINGVKALDEEEFLRADVNMSKTVEISDASAIVNHINGVKAIEGTV